MRYFLISFLFFAGGCDNKNGNTGPQPIEISKAPVSPKKENSKNKPPVTSVQWDLKYFYSTDKILARLVDSIYNSFSPSEKAAQMIMVATSEYKGIGLPFPAVLKLYNSRITGSILFLKGKKATFEREISTLNKASADNKIFPAVFACDCEPSLYHKKFTDADSVLPASELKEVADVQKVAAVISIEMKKMGIHWNFAPVADINSNKEIIDTRSFGDNNTEVIEKSTAFIRTSTESNIVTSVKHFPGHGAVKGDSHKNLVYIDSSFKEVQNFASIIQLGNPISVMVGHIAVKKYN
ncbi:MAG: glycoside hydrolase family 3 protein [Chitinophagaceae bacterium]|nr:glycoside hydrolase family 3 protein [Chitinophagaceae bacterium]